MARGSMDADADADASSHRRLAVFRQTLAALSVSLLGFCLGTTLGWTAPMQPLLMSRDPPVGSEPLSEDTVALLGSINFLGSMVGTFLWGFASDRLGRKTTSCLVALPYIISWSLILMARSSSWLVVARFIFGLGNSGTTIIVPAFISEIANDNMRGFFGCFLALFINTGILYAYVIGAYLKYHGLAVCSLIIPILFLLTFIPLPESPVFLMKQGEAGAQKSLLWYKGGDLQTARQTLVKYESNRHSETTRKSWFSTFSTKGTRKALTIGATLLLALQLSGIFTIINFSVRIFEISGTPVTPSQSAIIIAAVNLIFSVICSVVVDRLGRKGLIIGPLVVIAISQCSLGFYLYLFQGEEVSNYKWVPLVCLSIHVVAFATGLGPVPFVIKSEIFPPDLKGLALSQVALVNGFTAFLVVKLFPKLKEAINLYGCFWFYGGCSLFFALFFSYYLPETKNKSQSMILRILTNKLITKEDNCKEKADESDERLFTPSRTCNFIERRGTTNTI